MNYEQEQALRDQLNRIEEKLDRLLMLMGQPQSSQPPAMNALHAECHRLLAAGKKIQAIKHYRDVTQIGLKEAKEAVEELEAPPSTQQHQQSHPNRPSHDMLEREVLQLMHKSQKINAIKLYRQHTGLGLKEAKEAVESLYEQASQTGRLPHQAHMEKEIVNLMREGRTLDAIALYRRHFHMSQHDAQQRVEEIYRNSGLAW